MTILKATKRPVTVEAVKVTADNISAVASWCRGALRVWPPLIPVRPTQVLINTPEGTMTAHIGDYVIKGVAGEFYPCRADVFQRTYDVEEAQAHA